MVQRGKISQEARRQVSDAERETLSPLDEELLESAARRDSLRLLDGPSKRISMFIPLSLWRLLRAEAARRRLHMTEVFRQELAPFFERLKSAKRKR